MLWNHYVFRRGSAVHELWDRLHEGRRMRVLYIAGQGFDVRAKSVMSSYVNSVDPTAIDHAELLLVQLSDYQLAADLVDLTQKNAAALTQIFSKIGGTSQVSVGTVDGSDEELSASQALRKGADEVLTHVGDQTDIVLDVSSLPRVVYLTLLTGLLRKLVPNKLSDNALSECGINLQVLVAEDPNLDAQIRAEDPSNDPVLVPGFSGVVHAESVQDWPLVWFPILGEQRVNQLLQIMKSGMIPDHAEICPVLPHPSRNPRRADNLVLEYRDPLFDRRQTPTNNFLFVHESHPFEAYRQLLRAMLRYRKSFLILGGCRFVVTPLGSKLVTLGAALACFEIRPDDLNAKYGVAIPHAEPMRYLTSVRALQDCAPELCVLLLTGEAYSQAPMQQSDA